MYPNFAHLCPQTEQEHDIRRVQMDLVYGVLPPQHWSSHWGSLLHSGHHFLVQGMVQRNYETESYQIRRSFGRTGMT